MATDQERLDFFVAAAALTGLVAQGRFVSDLDPAILVAGDAIELGTAVFRLTKRRESTSATKGEPPC